MENIEVLKKKRPMMYYGDIRCHGKMYYVIPMDEIFCNIHIIGRLNVCSQIQVNRCQIDDYKNMQKSLAFFEVT